MTNLNELSWVEAKEYFQSNDVVLVPVGSNEQHGPQNPLGNRPSDSAQTRGRSV